MCPPWPHCCAVEETLNSRSKLKSIDSEIQHQIRTKNVSKGYAHRRHNMERTTSTWDDNYMLHAGLHLHFSNILGIYPSLAPETL